MTPLQFKLGYRHTSTSTVVSVTAMQDSTGQWPARHHEYVELLMSQHSLTGYYEYVVVATRFPGTPAVVRPDVVASTFSTCSPRLRWVVDESRVVECNS